MTKEKIVIELEKILNNPDDYEGLQLMNKLIETLKNDIKMESAKKTTKTSKITAIKKVLNHSACKYRPVLQKYDIQNGKMVFTNSYVAFRINEIENNPFSRVTDEDGLYPTLNFAFNNFNIDDCELVKIDYSLVKMNYKTKAKNMYINKNLFDTSYLLSALDIMPENTKYYLNSKNCIIYGINEDTEEDCIILGIRSY